MAERFELQPLFPLPNVVLFPKAILPLHIFEPRYRTMMADALQGGQTICMALLRPGWEADYYGAPAVYGVGCVGRVVQHQRLEDGRYNIALHGESKVAIEGFSREEPYRIARVRAVEEDQAWSASSGVEGEVAELLALFRRVRLGESAAVDLTEMYGPHVSPEAVLNMIAMNLNVEANVKQELLELDSLRSRFRSIVRYLRDSAAKQDLLDRVRHLYPGDSRRN
ncbi:MAG TPA: LON peptidase substrate-binding domain-containing protein [Candidatus Binatia bacterium]|nr:LON peptidase substrate-binding domain-containing protein [Candidatus Binatia bacterium]